MDNFAKFIPTKTELDANEVVNESFSSMPFPEVISVSEVIQLGRAIGQRAGTLWSYQYGEAPQKFENRPLDEIASLSFSEGPYNLLIEFGDAEVYIWQPSDHEFFVIFGSPGIDKLVTESGIFDYKFSDYAREDFFQGNCSENLKEIEKKYTIKSTII